MTNKRRQASERKRKLLYLAMFKYAFSSYLAVDGFALDIQNLRVGIQSISLCLVDMDFYSDRAVRAD